MPVVALVKFTVAVWAPAFRVFALALIDTVTGVLDEGAKVPLLAERLTQLLLSETVQLSGEPPVLEIV